MNLANCTVLVTGGKRLGKHVAMALARRGARLAFSAYSSSPAMEVIAAECQSAGSPQTAVYSHDLSIPHSCDQLVANVARDFGALHVLLNFTSTYYPTPWDELRPEQLDDLLGTNLKGPFWTAIAAAKLMRCNSKQHGIQGKILNCTDWAVDRPYPNYLAYLTAKGGLATFTRALAVELAPSITVNAIAPGTLLPPEEASPELIARLARQAALHRIGTPDDLVQAALFLLEGTDFVTGEIYRIDGGRFLGNRATEGDCDVF